MKENELNDLLQAAHDKMCRKVNLQSASILIVSLKRIDAFKKQLDNRINHLHFETLVKQHSADAVLYDDDEGNKVAIL